MSNHYMNAQVEYNGCIYSLKGLRWEDVIDASQRLGADVNSPDFAVTYLDEDQDRVTVKSVRDMAEAVNYANERRLSVLALKVSLPYMSDEEEWEVMDNMSQNSRSPRTLNNKSPSVTLPVETTTEPPELRSFEEFHVDEDIEFPTPNQAQESQESATDEKIVNEAINETEEELKQELLNESVVAQEEQRALDEIKEEMPQDADRDVERTSEVKEPQKEEVKTSSLEDILVLAMQMGLQATTDGRTLRQTVAKLLSNPRNVEVLGNLMNKPDFKEAVVGFARKETNEEKPSVLLNFGQYILRTLVESPELGSLVPYILANGLIPKKEEPVVVKPVVTHVNVQCDGCGVAPIVGVRYKSAVLTNFDLCEKCEAAGNYQSRGGPYLKIVDPESAPDAILCVLRGAGSASREHLDWRNPLAKEFLDFMDAKSQRSFQSTQQRTKDEKVRPVAPQLRPNVNSAVIASPPPPPVVAAPVAPIAVPVVIENVAKAAPVEIGSKNSSSTFGSSVPDAIEENELSEPQTQKQQSAGCKGGHFLNKFKTPHSGYICNVCEKKQATNTVMHGCRPCDYDVCSECLDGSYRIMDRAVPVTPQAKFVADVTLTDGCIVAPYEHLTKTWRVRNSGTEQWPVGTKIIHVGGERMSGPDGAEVSVEVPRANPGEAVNINVPLIMPSTPGRYISYWRLVTPTSLKFGHRFWVAVVVVDAPQVKVVPPPVVFGYPVVTPPKSMSNYPLVPSAPPAPVPSAPPSTDIAEHGELVAQIVDLGFNDVEKIARYLREENGNTTNVIDRLLAEEM